MATNMISDDTREKLMGTTIFSYVMDILLDPFSSNHQIALQVIAELAKYGRFSVDDAAQ